MLSARYLEMFQSTCSILCETYKGIRYLCLISFGVDSIQLLIINNGMSKVLIVMVLLLLPWIPSPRHTLCIGINRLCALTHVYTSIYVLALQHAHMWSTGIRQLQPSCLCANMRHICAQVYCLKSQGLGWGRVLWHEVYCTHHATCTTL